MHILEQALAVYLRQEERKLSGICWSRKTSPLLDVLDGWKASHFSSLLDLAIVDHLIPLVETFPLDRFTRAYLEAVLFTESDNDDGHPLNMSFTDHDFDDRSLMLAKKDCREFQEQFGHLINEETSLSDLEPEVRAGHDFWFTRNGHGVGFWEKDRWTPEEGAALTEAAESWGEIHAFVGDDGKIHLE